MMLLFRQSNLLVQSKHLNSNVHSMLRQHRWQGRALVGQTGDVVGLGRGSVEIVISIIFPKPSHLPGLRGLRDWSHSSFPPSD